MLQYSFPFADLRRSLTQFPDPANNPFFICRQCASEPWVHRNHFCRYL